MLEVRAARRIARVALVATALTFAALPLSSQEVEIEVGELFDAQNDIKLRVHPKGSAQPRLMDEDRLDESNSAAAEGYQVNYKYDETLLTPYPERKCYLHLWVVDPRAQGGVSEGKVATWYQKFELTVEGGFMDGAFELPMRITNAAGQRRSGTIIVVAHAMDPAAALSFPGPPPPRLLSMPPTSQKLGIKNNTRVPIRLGTPEVTPEEPSLWAKPAPSLTLDNALLQEQRENGMTLRAVPRSLSAYLKSFVSHESAAHATLRLRVPFEVIGSGKKGTVSDEVLVQFVPGPGFLLASLLAGAIFGVGTALSISKERRKILGSAQAPASVLGAMAQRVGLAMIVAFVVFLVFWLVKGKIGLFDISLDPQNSASAFLIGFIVGVNPPFYYQWIADRLPGRGRAAGAAGGAVLLLLLGAAVASAGSIVPVSVAHDPGSGEIYVLGSANEVYRLDLQSRRWTRMELPRLEGYTTSVCLVRQAGASWLARVASSRSSGVTWRTTVSLFGLSRGARSYQSSAVGFGRLYSVTYDAAGSRLVFSDEERGGIYQMAVGSAGLGRERLLYKASQILEPVSVLAANGRLYIGDDSREAVFELDLASPRKARELFEAEEPSGLALSADGASLFVADSDDAVVLRYDLRRGGRATSFAPDAPFEAPAAVVVDRAGHVWVADRGADVLFELDVDGRVLGRHAP